LKPNRLIIPLLCGLLLSPLVALGQGATPGDLDLDAYDEYNARDINEICAACHGEYGQGGGNGVYPRLAGLPAEYIAAQLRDFKSRARLNIPMLPFATDRELPEEDLRDIAIYLSRLELLTKMPVLDEGLTAYEKLLVAARIFNIPRLNGDMARGSRVLKESCKSCHGKRGEGRARVPQLAGQFSVYIRLQIELILAGERTHPDVEELFGDYGEADWEALLARLSVLDD
jgi:cytochrome c553